MAFAKGKQYLILLGLGYDNSDIKKMTDEQLSIIIEKRIKKGGINLVSSTVGELVRFHENPDENQLTSEQEALDLSNARRELVDAVKKVAKKRNAEEIAEFIGEEFIGYKGQAAIHKLLKERHGHIKAAFYREDIGDIDLVWGDGYSGLQHIIAHRERQGGIDIPKFLSELTDVIENGEFVKINQHGRLEFFKDKKMVIISAVLRGGHLTYLFTAYKTRKAPS